jgi:hypothetical protein
MLDEVETGIAHEVGDVIDTPGAEVVDAYHLMSFLDQPVAQVAAEKTRTSGNQRSHMYLLDEKRLSAPDAVVLKPHLLELAG